MYRCSPLFFNPFFILITMRTLQVTTETFNSMLSGLIQSGTTFEAEENSNGILIIFTGGY